jgi:hypothetical protein
LAKVEMYLYDFYHYRERFGTHINQSHISLKNAIVHFFHAITAYTFSCSPLTIILLASKWLVIIVVTHYMFSTHSNNLNHGVKMPHQHMSPPERFSKQSAFMVVSGSMSSNPSMILHHGVKMPDQHLSTPEQHITQKSDYTPMTGRMLPLPPSWQAELDAIAADCHIVSSLILILITDVISRFFPC